MDPIELSGSIRHLELDFSIPFLIEKDLASSFLWQIWSFFIDCFENGLTDLNKQTCYSEADSELIKSKVRNLFRGQIILDECCRRLILRAKHIIPIAFGNSELLQTNKLIEGKVCYCYNHF